MCGRNIKRLKKKKYVRRMVINKLLSIYPGQVGDGMEEGERAQT